MGAATFRLRLRYDGTAFHGWQVQPGVRTVQGEVERGLATILGHPVRIAGAGRTDRGVHAAGQVASFMADTALPDAALLRALRGLLPRDVVVASLGRAPDGFHARWSAVGRSYRYVLSERDTPAARRYAWVRRPLPDAETLTAATAPLIGSHRFDAFTVGEGRRMDTRCTIRSLDWTRRRRRLVCEIHSDRFLYRMVRLIVGSMVALERENRLDPAVVSAALAAGGFDRALPAAPPRGLFFVRADYPPDEEIVPVVNRSPDVE